MAEAYRCDICGKLVDGSAEMQFGLEPRGEQVWRHSLGIVHNPELKEEKTVHWKDLCPECLKMFCLFFRIIRTTVKAGKRLRVIIRVLARLLKWSERL
jgi:hypothetical protein